MLIQIILFILLGIISGVVTGLIPGIHINLVGTFLVSATFLSFVNPIYLIVFIVSLTIAHTFIDFIPSIFLGCPDTDSALSTLPGHKLLAEGHGYKAVMLTAYGGLYSLIIVVLFTILFLNINFDFYSSLSKIIPYILIGILFIMIFTEKKKINAAEVIILSGILGLCVLNLSSLKDPLFPLLTGLFGSSMLILSINNKTKIPPQKIEKPKINFLKPLFGSAIASPLCGFLPGLGSGQAAVLGNSIMKTDEKGFLTLVGATNIIVMSISFLAIYLISRMRTGAAVAVSELAGEVTLNLLILIIVCIIISGIISFFITEFISRKFANKINKINYSKLSFWTLCFLSAMTFAISSILGFLVFIVSTFTGIYFIKKNVKKTNMMGCLIIPTIVLYLF